MKSLVESLFDSDLVSKDTGLEYLYGIITRASIASDFKIEYFDEKKIKHDFNIIMKKFRPKQWSSNSLTGMDVYQKMEMNELLRELLYIIVCNIKTTDIPFYRNKIDEGKFEAIIKKFIDEYIDPNFSKCVNVMIITYSKEPDICNVRVEFARGLQSKISSTHRCIIRMEMDTTILK